MTVARATIVLTLGLILWPPQFAVGQTIDDLAWITGTWVTDLEDQALEERWSPPMANAMTGSFRWTRDGAVWLYEFLLIEETEDGIFYHLRHFGPGSQAWEERDAPLTYRLSTAAPGNAVFESVTTPGDAFIFTREDDQLTIEIRSQDGDPRRFVYSLAPAATAQPATADTQPDTATEPQSAPDTDSPEDS